MLLEAVEVPFLRDRVRDRITGGILLPQACLGEIQVNNIFLDSPPPNPAQPNPSQPNVFTHKCDCSIFYVETCALANGYDSAAV